MASQTPRTSSLMTSRKLILISKKYKVVRRIGGGSFGEIFMAINISNGEVIILKYFFNKVCYLS